MDGESLALADGEFDHVVLHLILAVLPDPIACAREVGRVLKPGGTVSIFDKFAPEDASPWLGRRAANLFTDALFSDFTRKLGPLVEAGGLPGGLRRRSSSTSSRSRLRRSPRAPVPWQEQMASRWTQPGGGARPPEPRGGRSPAWA
jgi:ubiquinone/menaquinone biosynthesis C-methylase UbiE